VPLRFQTQDSRDQRNVAEILSYFLFRRKEGASFSQLYAKVSILDICLIPIQAKTAGEGQGVYYQFNDTGTKICREFNMRRNVHSSADMAGRGDTARIEYLLHQRCVPMAQRN
jgi:hypothetical protein